MTTQVPYHTATLSSFMELTMVSSLSEPVNPCYGIRDENGTIFTKKPAPSPAVPVCRRRPLILCLVLRELLLASRRFEQIAREAWHHPPCFSADRLRKHSEAAGVLRRSFLSTASAAI